MTNTVTMLAVFVGFAVLACLGAFLLWYMTRQDSQGLYPLGQLRASKFDMFGRSHYFQIPPDPKGTFVMLHGCARSAAGYWPYHASTPECTGFPEDVAHTKHALVSGYAILVPSPINAKTSCFTFDSGDHKQVGQIIQEFQKRHNLTKKPVYLAGASAGGGTAIRLPEYLSKNGPDLRIDGIICEVATNNSPLVNGRPAIADFPPVVYVCMERDVQSQKEAREYIEGLARANTRAAMVISPRRKITPAFFAERMHGVTASQSKQLVDALRTVKMIDGEGWVAANPSDFDKPGTRASGWMARMKDLDIPRGREFTLGSVRSSPVYQAVAVAYAYHEHVADYTTAALKYFEARGEASMDDLVERYKVDVPAEMG